jgi:hypothetical protein
MLVPGRKMLIPGTLILVPALWLATSQPTVAQQTMSTVEPPRSADRTFRPEIAAPAYAESAGPAIMVDEAHNNFHTAVGTYWPFAEFLRRDGYVILRGTSKITPDLLQLCRIYVISDAQPPAKPGDPPTFSEDEIRALNEWVEQGGSLFIITDHMPDPPAIAPIAESFGLEVNNGYVLNGAPQAEEKPLVFSRAGGTLKDHVVTNGRNPDEAVQVVATFTGSAFRAREEFRPILIFGEGRSSWMPEKLYEFTRRTPTLDVSGWFQGGVREYGEGRLAFFSEAAMFTAQAFEGGRVRFGMNNPEARDNAQLLLNVVHWLSGTLDPPGN